MSTATDDKWSWLWSALDWPGTKWLFLILGLSQLTFGLINVGMFQRAYTVMAQDNSQLTAKIIRRTVQGVAQKGIAYGELIAITGYTMYFCSEAGMSS